MNFRCDENARERNFKAGDKVLTVLPIPGRPMQARYYDPYTVDRKVSDINSIINTPGTQKHKQLCHINMLEENNTKAVTKLKNFATLVEIDS